MKIRTGEIGKYIVYIIIFTIFFRGFIRNFFGIGTTLVDVAFGVCIVWSIIIGCKTKLHFHKEQMLYFIWAISCVVVYFVQCLLGRTKILGGVLGFRNIVIYSSLFICVNVILKKEDIKCVYCYIERTGFLLCGFAVIQYLGRNILPPTLLNASDAETYWYLENNAIRVNGLVGNTIIFGAFAVIMVAIIWAELIAIHYKSLALWIKLVVCICACFLTFGRACFVGCWIVLAVEWFLDYWTDDSWHKFVRVIKIVLVVSGIVVVLLTVFRESIIVIRLLDQNSVMNVATNRAHSRVIREAIEIISDWWLWGYGIDKAGFSISDMRHFIIGDGTFWIWLLQWGIIPVFIFGLLVFKTIKHAFNVCREEMSINKKTAMMYLALNAYFLPATIINSTYDSRICIMLVWLIAGFMYLCEKEG